MRAADQVDVEILGEFLYHVLAEGVTYAPLVLPPALDVRVGVGPQEIAEQALVWHFDGPLDAGDVLQTGEIGREPAVHADDLLIDDCADGHDVEDVEEVLPDLQVVPALA
jgi:hypothetical protein